MNLRALSNRMTRRVNPNLSALHYRSAGYSTAPSGKRGAFHEQPVPIVVQMQALTKKEIEHLDALNLSNATTAVYANRQLTGIDRLTGSGGDLITFDDVPAVPPELRSTRWLVTAVLEGWTGAGWCRAALTRQQNP